ncbi:MAG: sulfatase [Pirellulaceae bacterium]
MGYNWNCLANSFVSNMEFDNMIRSLTINVLLVISAKANWVRGETTETRRKPNVVVIFIDDMGYADIGSFGAKDYQTPNLDKLAKSGRRFTDFVVPSAVCSASRAALLTGCYHRRVGISGALGPNARHGISSEEFTLAEVCKSAGYRTACFGKWHLGNHEPFLPLQHGFDQYFGLPYSNDMWPLHPDYADLPPESAKRKQGYPPLPLYEGNEIVDPEVTGEDQEQLTTWYTERAVKFIDESGDDPFFLYVPHSMVHVPLFVSDKFKGKSGAGLFGDVVMEIDWSVGQIVDALKRNGVAEDTLLIFTSDNGPWLSYGDHAGSAGRFREGKGTMWEGGVREPTIMVWPGRIPENTTCDELASTIDILPTVAKLTGVPLPNHPIDGMDISDLMFGDAKTLKSPHESFYYYYAGGQLQAVRDRQWKLVLPHQYRTLDGRAGGSDGKPASYSQAKVESMELYDLKADPEEKFNVIDDHQDIVDRLNTFAEVARTQLGDTLTDRKGAEIRGPGRLPPENGENQ